MSELKEELEELRQEIEDTWEPWMKDAAHWEGGDGAKFNYHPKTRKVNE